MDDRDIPDMESPETFNNGIELMVRRAAFGEQVDSFVKSDIGQYLINRAIDQKEQAQEQFKKVSVFDTKAVLMLQNKIIVSEWVEEWLKQAIDDGLRALNILDDRG